ncbi:hypothetical protein NQ176_g388 [Zarea fungicola]|uniref:Uncharacterized protein n=1 Tax=Zarea fungicola TaxID=93591 RepID=A0ACC1NYB2_9HYPO|nr:hypothetical protein NQ176_g388 [Lecanicillium fungicola]
MYSNTSPAKSERSHEQNQERAYIAASRRTDRSLEARLQSARMASDIHKQRTGKSFRISEEIVMQEEIYEEEDDDLPCSYRILRPNMQTACPAMNYRVEAYLSNKVTMSAMLAGTNDEWRQNEVNKLFDEMFPCTSFNPHRTTSSNSRDAQRQQQQPMHPHYSQQPNALQDPGQCPPPADFTRQESGIGLPTAPARFDNSPQPDAPINLESSRSAFATELAPEARMMIGVAGVDPSHEPTPRDWSSIDLSFCMSGVGGLNGDKQLPSPTSEAFDMAHMKWAQMGQRMLPVDDTTWSTFINDSAWASDQP